MYYLRALLAIVFVLMSIYGFVLEEYFIAIHQLAMAALLAELNAKEANKHGA